MRTDTGEILREMVGPSARCCQSDCITNTTMSDGTIFLKEKASQMLSYEEIDSLLFSSGHEPTISIDGQITLTFAGPSSTSIASSKRVQLGPEVEFKIPLFTIRLLRATTR